MIYLKGMVGRTEVRCDDVWGKVRCDVKYTVAATITRNWHGPGEIIVQLGKRSLEIRRWWPIFQFPYTGVLPFGIVAKQVEEPANCDLSFDICETIHDRAAAIAVFLDEVLRSPFYVEFVKDSFDNNGAAFNPDLPEGFLSKRRVVERYCWMKGGIILGDSRICG